MALEMTVLLDPQLAINGAPFQQHGVGANIDNFALFHNKNLVAIGQRRQAMRNDDHCPPTADPQQIRIHHGFAFRIERARRLVENQDTGVVDERSSNCNSLLLTARKIGRAFFNITVIAVGHAFDEFFGACQARGLNRVLRRQAGTSGDDVVADRTSEQEVVLQDDAQILPQMTKVDLSNVDAVDLHKSAVFSVDRLQ